MEFKNPNLVHEVQEPKFITAIQESEFSTSRGTILIAQPDLEDPALNSNQHRIS